jgi:hypothetical protein
MELLIEVLNVVTAEEEQANLSCEDVGSCEQPVAQESNADNKNVETSAEFQKNENSAELLEMDQVNKCLEEQTEVLDQVEESEEMDYSERTVEEQEVKRWCRRLMMCHFLCFA